MQKISIPLDAFAPIKRANGAGLAEVFHYNLTPQESHIIDQIVARLQSMLAERDPIRAATEFDPFTVAMDIATIHCNDRRLNLSQLLMSDASDFRRDLIAIRIHINRAIGKLPNEIRLHFEENKI